MAEFLVSCFPITAGEFIGECFRTDAIDTDREIAIGNGRISCFDTPQRFAGRDTLDQRARSNSCFTSALRQSHSD